jgi:hypothetical protein
MNLTDWICLFFANAGGTALGIFIMITLDEWKNK